MMAAPERYGTAARRPRGADVSSSEAWARHYESNVMRNKSSREIAYEESIDQMRTMAL